MLKALVRTFVILNVLIVLGATVYSYHNPPALVQVAQHESITYRGHHVEYTIPAVYDNWLSFNITLSGWILMIVIGSVFHRQIFADVRSWFLHPPQT